MVVTPFLPGDSLIFAAGSLSAQSSNNLSVFILGLLLIVASVLGNQINYWIGTFIGSKVFYSEKGYFFNKRHLQETQEFYARHGAKTIVYARFLPIIRTFAPFVAGIGKMPLAYFSAINLLSAILWIGSLLSFGYFFGSLPYIQSHFTMVIYGIVLLSLLPIAITWLKRFTN